MIKILEEMKYAKNQMTDTKVIAYGQMDGRFFIIMNRNGLFPLAYVESKPGDPQISDNDDNDLEVYDGYDVFEETIFDDKDDGIDEWEIVGPWTLDDRLEVDDPQLRAILALKYWGWAYNAYGEDYFLEETAFGGLRVSPGLVHCVKEMIYENIKPLIGWLNRNNKFYH